MKTFEENVAECSGGALYCRDIETLQCNLGFKCNQQCAHCHVSYVNAAGKLCFDSVNAVLYEKVTEVFAGVNRRKDELVREATATGSQPQEQPAPAKSNGTRLHARPLGPRGGTGRSFFRSLGSSSRSSR